MVAFDMEGNHDMGGTPHLNDHTLAAHLAAAAGQVLLTMRSTGVCADYELGRTGDAVSQQLLACALHVHRPRDSVLSEEAVADPARMRAQRVWIIDPVDGSREFGERREDWAVHVALTIDGVPGPSAVALPGLDRVLSTADAPSARAATTGRMRIAVSRRRAPAVAARVANRLGADLMPMGSAGFKAMAVLMGNADAYLHAGGQYEWDSAAPVGVALAHGLHASRIDGSPLVYNRPDPSLPDLLICRPELTGALLAALASEQSA